MGAALSIALLFTISSTIVRVAGVFLEHTGIPRNIARLQAMSALSGTGFTTSESELLLQTPERRRVLTVLIISGSIGLASIVATLVASALGVADTMNGIFYQAAAIFLSFLYVRYILLSSWFDDFVCGIANRWLIRRGAGELGFAIFHVFSSDNVLGEHLLSNSPADAGAWPKSLVLLGVREGPGRESGFHWLETPDETRPGDRLIMVGPEAAHRAFAAAHGARIAMEHPTR